MTSFAYDAEGRQTTVTEADGSITTSVYDALGREVSWTDALGRQSTFLHDANNRLVSETSPDGKIHHRSYDAEGRLISASDAEGRVTRFSYDAAGRLLTTSAPDQTVTTRTYDSAGQMIALTNTLGHSTLYEYDIAGRQIRVGDPLGQNTLWGFDAAGRLVSLTEPNGGTTVYSYDAADRLRTITHPDGHTLVAGYDAAGRRISERDENGRTTSFIYDALGRLEGVTDALEQTTRYTYDEVGNRILQTDAAGRSERLDYDQRGRPIRRTLVDGSSEVWRWNVDATLASHIDFSNQLTTFIYDARQRLVRRVGPGDSEVRFTYSSTGQRTSVEDTRGVTHYEYDDRDRLVRKVEPEGWELTYGYDGLGNRIRLTATVGGASYTTSTTYDPVGRPLSRTNFNGGTFNFTWDVGGYPVEIKYPNGAVASTDWNDRGQVERQDTRTELGEILVSFDYTLDATGRRLGIEEQDGTSRRFVYDPLYRLIEEEVLDSAGARVIRHQFSYDAVGNRIQQLKTSPEGNVETISSAYDDRNRLLTTGGSSLIWDVNGRLLTDGNGRTFLWDAYGRLLEIALLDGQRVRTTYDADGNRTRSEWTTSDGQTERLDYLVDTNESISRVVAEIRNGQIETLFLHGDQPLALSRPASEEQRYFVAEAPGSIRALLAEQDTVTDRYAFTAFGEPLTTVGDDTNPYRFAAEPYDPLAKLLYLRSRWLDPYTGRFISRDSMHGVPTLPTTFHKFVYALNEPLNRIDPLGTLSSGNISSSLASLSISSNLSATTAQITFQVARPVLAKTGLRLLLQRGVAVGTASAVLLAQIAAVPSQQLELTRARFRLRGQIESQSQRRRTSILYHYTDAESALSVAMTGIIKASSKKKTAGYVFPPGAYATDIPPWSADWRQKALSAYFYGGSELRDMSWFVAIAKTPDFLGPLPFPGFGSQYYRPAPEGWGVPVIVVTHGPNLMLP